MMEKSYRLLGGVSPIEMSKVQDQGEWVQDQDQAVY